MYMNSLENLQADISAVQQKSTLSTRTLRGMVCGGLMTAALIASVNEASADTLSLDDGQATPACDFTPQPQSFAAVRGLWQKPISTRTLRSFKSRLNNTENEIKKLDTFPSNTPEEQAAFLNEAGNITAPYGVKFEIVDAGDFLASDALKTWTGRQAVEMTARGITRLPLSYTRMSGATVFKLYNDPTSDFDAYVSVQAEDLDSGIHINLAKEQSIENVAHEETHLVDAQECGSEAMDNDPSYTSFNAPGLTYTGQNDNVLEAKNFSLVDILSNEKPQNIDIVDSPGSCNIETRQPVMKKASVVSAYSLKNPAEDKAEMFSSIAEPFHLQDVVGKNVPRLRNKFMFLMARLFEKNPTAARDIIAVAERPESLKSNFGKC